MSLDYLVDADDELRRQRSRRRWMIALSFAFYIAFVIAIFVCTNNRGRQ